MIGIEFVVDLIWKELLRNGYVRKSRIPDDRLNVIDLFDLIAKRRNVAVGHIFHYYQ